MRNIAIITARGGSKRIPKKNIKDFCGKPMISYSIEAALNAGIFDEVMVSTDSKEIANVAISYGARVPFYRSSKTSNDFATTADVLKEVLECYEERGYIFERLCCIYPTAPFVTSEKLQRAMTFMEEQNADSLIPVVRFSFPPQRAFVVKNGTLQYQYPENALKRSQDLKPLYHDCGQFYICSVSSFKESGSLIANRCVPFILPEEEVQDIDNLSDWIQAEIKYKSLALRGEGSV